MTARLAREHRVALVLGLLTVAVFLPGVWGGFVYDDVPLIVQNDYVRDPDQLPRLLTGHFWATSTEGSGAAIRPVYRHLWRPWVSLAYATQFQAFGESPLGYHVISLLLHLACVLLAFGFLRRRLPDVDGRWLAAGVGAAVFALHPSRPETVAWISGSTDLWMTFWLLLGALALSRRHLASRLAGGLCLALAVWCKEAAVVVPVLFAFDAWALHGRRPRLAVEGVAAAGVAIAIVSRWLVGPGMSGVSPEWHGAIPRVLSTLGHFVDRTLLPWPPAMEPAPRVVGSGGEEVFSSWTLILGGVTALASAGALAASIRRKALRPWAADAAWFLLLVAPVLNLVDLLSLSLVSDRFLYAPMLGVAALAARAVTVLVRRGRAVRRWTGVAGGLALVFCIAVTALRTTQFSDDEALWTAELAGNPNAMEGLGEMGRILSSRGDYEGALRLFERGLDAALRSGQDEAAAGFALRIATIAVLVTPDADLEAHRKILRFTDELRAHPRMELDLPGFQIDVELPRGVWRKTVDTVPFQLLRAKALAHNGRLADAESELEDAADAQPEATELWRLLAAVRARRGEWEAADAAAQRALESAPNRPRLAQDLTMLDRAHRLSSQPARDEVDGALRDARVRMLLGWPGGARRILARALAAHPEDPDLIVEMAQVEAADRRPEVARRILEEARRRDPGHAGRYDALLRQLTPPAGSGETGS